MEQLQGLVECITPISIQPSLAQHHCKVWLMNPFSETLDLFPPTSDGIAYSDQNGTYVVNDDIVFTDVFRQSVIITIVHRWNLVDSGSRDKLMQCEWLCHNSREFQNIVSVKNENARNLVTQLQFYILEANCICFSLPPGTSPMTTCKTSLKHAYVAYIHDTGHYWES